MNALLLAAADAVSVADPTVVADSTPTGVLLFGVYLLVGVALLAAASMVAVVLAQKAKSNKAWDIANRVWLLGQTVVAHVEAALRPQVQLALKDGKVTPEEAAKLKSEAMRLFKEALAEQGVTDLRSALGLTLPAVDVFLSGLLERALGRLKAAPAAGLEVLPPTPTAAAPVLPRP